MQSTRLAPSVPGKERRYEDIQSPSPGAEPPLMNEPRPAHSKAEYQRFGQTAGGGPPCFVCGTRD